MKRLKNSPTPTYWRIPTSFIFAFSILFGVGFSVGGATLTAGCSSKSAKEKEGSKESTSKTASGQKTPNSDTTDVKTVPKNAIAPKLSELPQDDGQQSGAHKWSVALGGLSRDSARAVAFDKEGNIYLGGLISGEVTIGDHVMKAESQDAVIIKLDAQGKPLWSRHFGGPGSDMIESLAIDSKGNVIVGGGFAEELRVGDSSLKASGSDDGFVAKFDSTGRRIWAKRLGNLDSDSVWSVAVDSTDNILVSASIRGHLDFGGQHFKTGGRDDAFLLSLAPDNTLRWVRQLASPGDDFGRGIATDRNGTIYWSVEFSQTAKLGGSDLALESAGNRDAGIIRFDEDGKPRWGHRFGGLGDESINDISVDGGGDISVVGEFKETMEFGTATLRSAGADDIFVAKLASDGSPRWATRFGNKTDDLGATIGGDRFGNVYVGGWFRGGVDFGGGERKAVGEKDIFVAKLDRLGKHVWSKSFGGKQVDFLRKIAIGPDDQPVLVGTFFLSVNFGGAMLNAKSEGTVPRGEIYAVKLGR